MLVWAGGPSLEWGSGNLADGAVLAARGHLVVVTLNYRLGLLGMLPGRAGEPGGALQDGAAALRWVRDNIAVFGGDPARVTLSGTRDAALYVNTLLMMPELAGECGLRSVASSNEYVATDERCRQGWCRARCC